ncbi:MAG TPA: ATP-binding cassette domain-containing protein [Planctomycetota bacterium]|nr:ATP-binding cassette domain-containing protein [Planctomycetota bacterium]
MSAAIRLEGVSKAFGAGPAAVQALRSVSLSIPAGAAVVVAGPSGSGKTTLLSLLGGLDSPDAGRVVVDGLEVSALGERERSAFRRRRVGFAFQEAHLLEELTILENATVPPALLGLPRRAGDERARGLLAQLGLGGRTGAYPRELSGGERQRAAIARALSHGPGLVLADEPTANLDSQSAQEVTDLLLELCARHGATAVLATHDPRVIGRVPGRVILKDGAVERVEGLPAAD